MRIKSRIKNGLKKVRLKLAPLIPVSLKTNSSKAFCNEEFLQPVPGRSKGTTCDDEKLISRIITAYKLSASEKEDRGTSMWQAFFDERHRPIHDLFINSEVEKIKKILRDPGQTDLFYGFDNLMSTFQAQVTASAENEIGHANICLDGLVRLAEALGAISLRNPESQVAPSVYWKGDTIVQEIEKRLGFSLTFPNPYPNECGVATSKGIVSYRVPQAIYQAVHIKKLLGNIKNPRVLELGAGLGRTAYYARQLGIMDYTIVDLPFSLISSGYFLGRNLGEENMHYFGEADANSQNKIKILPPQAFLEGSEKYDLIINADSLTEMDENNALKYWNKIKESTKVFLSINHEINPFTVRNLTDQSQSKVERYPYWLRRGYVEEVITF